MNHIPKFRVSTLRVRRFSSICIWR